VYQNRSTLQLWLRKYNECDQEADQT